MFFLMCKVPLTTHILITKHLYSIMARKTIDFNRMFIVFLWAFLVVCTRKILSTFSSWLWLWMQLVSKSTTFVTTIRLILHVILVVIVYSRICNYYSHICDYYDVPTKINLKMQLQVTTTTIWLDEKIRKKYIYHPSLVYPLMDKMVVTSLIGLVNFYN